MAKMNNDFQKNTVFKPIGDSRSPDQRVRFRVRRVNRFGPDHDDVQYTMQLFTSVPGKPGIWAWLDDSFDHYLRPGDIRCCWEVEGYRQLSLFSVFNQ